MKTIVFFDDFLIHRQESIRRIVHTPTWIEEHCYSDPVSLYGMGYASVVPSPTGGYYLYYITLTGVDRATEMSTILCMAESDDGLRWKPAPVGTDSRGITTNVLVAGMPAPAGCCVYYDESETDSAKRYKMTNSPIARTEEGLETLPSCIAESSDGVNWTSSRTGSFLPHHSDTYNSLIRNPVSDRYQITLRRRWGERRVCLVESPDLLRWTPPRPIVHPSPIDPPSTHFYGMPQFYYRAGEVFIGFLWNQLMPYNDVMGGPVLTEYAYSYDGLMWNRTHAPAMPRREPGQYGAGSMYGAAMIERDEDVLVYAVARLEEHHRIHDVVAEGRRSGVLLPGLLRKNGFVSLASTRGCGEITTECLLLSSTVVSLNVKAPLGGVRVQVCDPEYRPVPGFTYNDCREIRGDRINAVVRWRNGADLGEIVRRKRWIRLQVRLEQADLYSIDADFAYNINIHAPIYRDL